MFSAPRVVDIPPQEVHDFIEAITSSVYELSHQQGGEVPYTVIREITENFIHAGFSECTVSILEGGNTLRFADQGPGITKKDLVLQPGVSSASSVMKEYIRGVGSGFPIVREYLSTSHGFISLEDNAEDGVVVTLSLLPASSLDTTPLIQEEVPSAEQPIYNNAPLPKEHEKVLLDTPPFIKTQNFPKLTKREEKALLFLHEHGMLGPVDLATFLEVSAPTATRLLQKMELLGMVETTQLKKRILSNLGMAYVQALLVSGTAH